MASGKPVIAYAKGGALETVIDGKTGVLFSSQTEKDLNEAVEISERTDWDPAAIRKHMAAQRKSIDIPLELQAGNALVFARSVSKCGNLFDFTS